MHNKKLYKCALGKRGITKNKREGDKKTPAGVFFSWKSVLSKRQN